MFTVLICPDTVYSFLQEYGIPPQSCFPGWKRVGATFTKLGLSVETEAQRGKTSLSGHMSAEEKVCPTAIDFHTLTFSGLFS